MIIKVCGMKEAGNILRIAALGIDWMGFIFWEGSKRKAEAGTVAIDLPGICKTGVFVDACPEEIMALAGRCRLECLQLHGNESPDLCRSLRAKGYRVVKAIPIAGETDLRQAADYDGAADYFLFDTRTPGYGGSGRSFDWNILQAYDQPTPFLLSGGINPGSLRDLRSFKHPRFAGIDLNSGFETEPGIKDADALALFINSLNHLNNESHNKTF
jgi:phosphoribosylanthranilate isomerase